MCHYNITYQLVHLVLMVNSFVSVHITHYHLNYLLIAPTKSSVPKQHGNTHLLFCVQVLYFK